MSGVSHSAAGQASSYTSVFGDATVYVYADGAIKASSWFTGRAAIGVDVTGCVAVSTKMQAEPVVHLYVTGTVPARITPTGNASLLLSATGNVASLVRFRGAPGVRKSAVGSVSASAAVTGCPGVLRAASGEVASTVNIAGSVRKLNGIARATGRITASTVVKARPTNEDRPRSIGRSMSNRRAARLAR